ncbi:DUF1398 family protein [Staphylococcus caeli]|uniref:Phage envelope protein n=1 Tax=Staphylococcus caeli TaxID=2201815 RepID=A0A1D4JJS4_9STAP|nr:DUF1398 family protein [Staphylococcus caeli]SCS43303.1 phage envelope protein [Staphylococcus caeli]SCS61954.1 phage envelope protein [Staphylococcus caeli]
MDFSTFSRASIHQAHAQYTGVDFPKLFQAFKNMGMAFNIVNIKEGTTTYTHKDGAEIIDEGIKSSQSIAISSDKAQIQDILRRHQAGETDFPTFCEEMAHAGIYKWEIDLSAGTCAYIDLANKAVITEYIPQ